MSRRRCSSGPISRKLSRSELFVVMTGGMAGIAGTVLVLYAQFLRNAVPDAAGHLIIASVLGAPVAVMIGQIMVPDENDTRTNSLEITEPVAESTMDAIAKGATAGLALLLNMIAMLIVFVALVHLVNADARPAAAASAASRSRCSACSASSWRRCAG